MKWDLVKLSRKYTKYQLQKLVNHTPIFQKCLVCQEKFDAQSYVFRKTAIYLYVKKTCSDKCKRIFGGQKNKKIFKKYICESCQQPFIPHKAKPHQRFCTKKCRGRLLRGRKRPEVQQWVHKISIPKNSISKWGTEWLNQFELTHREHIIIVNGIRYRVDGFNQTTNTIYEYFGSFWHGNPIIYKSDDVNPVCKKTFGQLYNETIIRIKNLKEAGYTVITEWSGK